MLVDVELAVEAAFFFFFRKDFFLREGLQDVLEGLFDEEQLVVEAELSSRVEVPSNLRLVPTSEFNLTGIKCMRWKANRHEKWIVRDRNEDTDSGAVKSHNLEIMPLLCG